MVHHAASGVNALGCKIGAVPTQIFKVEIVGVSAKSPLMSVFQYLIPVVGGFFESSEALYINRSSPDHNYHLLHYMNAYVKVGRIPV